MNLRKLNIILLTCFFISGCSSGTITPNTQSSTDEMNLTATTPLILPVTTVTPSETLESDFLKKCVNLTEVPLNTDALKGLLILFDFDLLNYSSYFFDPSSNQLLDIEKKTSISWDNPVTNVSTTIVSPDKKLIQVYLIDKNYAIIRTVDKVINTYDIQGQEDWNRGRWLDNEHMFFQYWQVPNGNTIIIYNTFTGEKMEVQLELPNPYIVIDGGGKAAWVKADIDPSLKWVLYNDKEERLVLWNLDTQKEIVSMPSPTDLTEGTWSPDGQGFAIPSPSQTSDIPVASELFTITMDGTVNKLTNFNENYPFASVDTRPSWSPNGRFIAYWLKLSKVANPNPDDLQHWLAITDTTSFSTEIYCFSSTAGGIGWSPDSTQIIINTKFSDEEVKPVLIDLIHQTQAVLDTHGLFVAGWMSP